MAQCQWEIKIDGCEDISFFRIITEIALTLHIITFILSTSLLLYRKIKCNSTLWNGQCFTALDGFLLWTIIWNIGRIIFTIDKLIIFTKDSVILRYILFEIMAFPPIIAVASYASGLFYAIPRMNFHQLTSTRKQFNISTSLKSKLNNIVKNSQPSQIYLPRPHIVSYFYWFFVAFFFIMTLIPLIISAIAEQNNNNKLRKIFWSFHYLMYALAYGILTIVLVYYGQMLVRLAEESASLSNDEFEKQKYKKFVNKMKIFNLTLSFVFLWIILILTIFAFGRTRIYSFGIVNKMFAIMLEISPATTSFTTVCALLYSEMMPLRIVVAQSTIWSRPDNESHDYTEEYNNDNIVINETRDSNITDTRTSWYIGGTRVQPPQPTGL